MAGMAEHAYSLYANDIDQRIEALRIAVDLISKVRAESNYDANQVVSVAAIFYKFIKGDK
jgi:hypothetical protein